MLKHKNTIIGSGLLGLALGCSAVTLGPVQGAAAIGRTLNLTIPVQMAEDDDVTSACLEADVFHGDAQQDSRRINLVFEPGTQPLTGVVRLTSWSPVDEPSVTIDLRAGCLQKSRRRYVLLADVPSDAGAVPSSPMSTANARVIAPVTTAAPAIKTAASNLPAVAAPAKPRAFAPKAKKPTRENLPPRANPFATVVSTPPAPQTAVSAPPPGTSSEELLRQTTRAQAMEEAVLALKTISANNQRSLTVLGDKIQKAEATGHSKWWVYALVALLATTVSLAFALVWNPQLMRQRASGKWNDGK